MAASVHAESHAPREIAGGFVLVPVAQLLETWRACQRGPLGIADFRAWLACREMLARRCSLDPGRSATYGLHELARLTGVSPRRTGASVARLVDAGLLAWSDDAIAFPDRPPTPGDGPDDALADSIGGGRGSLAIPRRVLRHLAAGARPSLIATALAVLLRCLARGRGGFRSRGRLKASWIARAFDVDPRRVKQARKELVALGWIAPEPAARWAENRWGRAYTIDLGWDRAGPRAGSRLPPPRAAQGPRLPPPDSDREPLRGEQDQEPAPGGPAGVEIQARGEESDRPSSPPTTADPRGSIERGPISGPPVVADDGAGGGPPAAPRLEDVRAEDLEDTGRLLRLYDQAVGRGLVGPSEADRLRFVGAAEHARSVGKGNPPGLFAYLVRNRLWRYSTQGDEDRAHARIKREVRGGPSAVRVGEGAGARAGPPASGDVAVVGAVRAAMIRAGIFRDAFSAFAALNPGWTRERWDRAWEEAGSRCGPSRSVVRPIAGAREVPGGWASPSGPT